MFINLENFIIVAQLICEPRKFNHKIFLFKAKFAQPRKFQPSKFSAIRYTSS